MARLVRRPSPDVLALELQNPLRSRGGRWLLVASVVARLPLGMTLAILLLMHRTTGGYADAGAVVGAFGIGAACVAPVFGRLADRVGQPVVVRTSACLCATLLICLMLAATNRSGLVVLLALGSAAGGMSPPVAAGLRVLWREVPVDAEGRERLYVLDAVVQEVIWSVGPVLVGSVILVASAEAAVALMAVLTLLGSWWFAAHPAIRAWRGSQGVTARPVVTPGRRHGSRAMRAALVSALLTGIAMGAIEVALPAIASHLHSVSLAGLLLGLCSLGSMVGGLLYGQVPKRRPLEQRYTGILVACALLVVPLLLVASLPVALPASFVSGFGWAPSQSALYSIVSHGAATGSAAEAFTRTGSGIAGGLAIGAALAGLFADSAGTTGPVLLSSGAAVIAALSTLPLTHRSMRVCAKAPCESPR